MGKLSQAMEKSGNTRAGKPIAPQPLIPLKQRPTLAEPMPDPRSDYRSDPRSDRDDPFLDFVRRAPSLEDRAIAREIETSIPQGLHPSLITALNPHSIEAEQFRLLKNNILFPEKGVPPRSIMITSPSPDEGKSFVSANLAVSIAQSIDEYVLLMDCDLRGPSIHTLFGMDNTIGLSEHLSSSIPLSSLLKKTFIDKLTLLPGGTIPPNPSELLSSEQMRGLLSEVKSRYSDRYVIIDTPPPNITSETSAIARIVDGIIIVVRQGKTKKKAIQDIIDIYGKDKILGVIKNFSKTTHALSYQYKKYGYVRS